jgi:hypothetical protein
MHDDPGTGWLEHMRVPSADFPYAYQSAALSCGCGLRFSLAGSETFQTCPLFLHTRFDIQQTPTI